MLPRSVMCNVWIPSVSFTCTNHALNLVLTVLNYIPLMIVQDTRTYLKASLPAQQCRTRHSCREETGPPAPRSGHHLQTQARNPATQWTEAAEHVFNQKPTTATNCLYHSRTYFQFTL